VHLAHIGFPIVADKLYASRAQLTYGEVRHRREDTTVLLDRQALHARRLKIAQPLTGQMLEFVADLPADLEGVLAELREYRKR
jgi:23S rRNA pseudouridine1911/1915/1917 synthase